jgi:hypothetical protein
MILGAIERKYDPRDYSLDKLNTFLGQTIDIPDVFTFNIGIADQNYQASWPACGAHTGSHLIEVFEYYEKLTKTRISPAYIWKRIKQIDGYQLDVGTDMRSIFKVLASKGGCEYHLLPNNYSQNLAQYSDASVITPQMDEDAQPRIINTNYGFLTDKSFESITRATYLHKAVILLIFCDSGFFRTDKPTFTENKYGHFVLAIGYDKDNIIVLDSTEEKYPVKYINKKYIKFIREVGTCVDLSNEYVKNLVMKKNLLEKILALYTQLKKLLVK